MFVLHRQENLFNEDLVRALVEKIIQQSKKTHCVFILHHLTELALSRIGLLATLQKVPTITTVRRLPYIEFMQLLSTADYVVTDGGSNQEECYYLGKPCLILRKVTERTEGLGHNVLLSKLDLRIIESFLSDSSQYMKSVIHPSDSPSQIIVRQLELAIIN
jgi:UDP-N-acetylglucosamine 2-epimerase (non-hydrolysing)